jgi:hypothetical protein
MKCHVSFVLIDGVRSCGGGNEMPLKVSKISRALDQWVSSRSTKKNYLSRAEYEETPIFLQKEFLAYQKTSA